MNRIKCARIRALMILIIFFLILATAATARAQTKDAYPASCNIEKEDVVWEKPGSTRTHDDGCLEVATLQRIRLTFSTGQTEEFTVVGFGLKPSPKCRACVASSPTFLRTQTEGYKPAEGILYYRKIVRTFLGDLRDLHAFRCLKPK
jgi:hypothetical protein